jgi:crotonobetainyl-CoA:carnitine CoA-transferase CaiB-like acyl-CoA transferase
VLERPELVEDPRFRTNKDRRGHIAELNTAVEASFRLQPRDAWIERCRRCGVPCGSVRTLTEAVAAPEPRARGMIQTVEHPTAGRYQTVGSPLRLSDTPVRAAGPAPTLGEHTDAVLREVLGYDRDRIAALRAGGAID